MLSTLNDSTNGNSTTHLDYPSQDDLNYQQHGTAQYDRRVSIFFEQHFKKENFDNHQSQECDTEPPHLPSNIPSSQTRKKVFRMSYLRAEIKRSKSTKVPGPSVSSGFRPRSSSLKHSSSRTSDSTATDVQLQEPGPVNGADSISSSDYMSSSSSSSSSSSEDEDDKNFTADSAPKADETILRYRGGLIQHEKIPTTVKVMAPPSPPEEQVQTLDDNSKESHSEAAKVCSSFEHQINPSDVDEVFMDSLVSAYNMTSDEKNMSLSTDAETRTRSSATEQNAAPETGHTLFPFMMQTHLSGAEPQIQTSSRQQQQQQKFPDPVSAVLDIFFSLEYKEFTPSTLLETEVAIAVEEGDLEDGNRILPLLWIHKAVPTSWLIKMTTLTNSNKINWQWLCLIQSCRSPEEGQKLVDYLREQDCVLNDKIHFLACAYVRAEEYLDAIQLYIQGGFHFEAFWVALMFSEEQIGMVIEQWYQLSSRGSKLRAKCQAFLEYYHSLGKETEKPNHAEATNLDSCLSKSAEEQSEDGDKYLVNTDTNDHKSGPSKSPQPAGKVLSRENSEGIASKINGENKFARQNGELASKPDTKKKGLVKDRTEKPGSALTQKIQRSGPDKKSNPDYRDAAQARNNVGAGVVVSPMLSTYLSRMPDSLSPPDEDDHQDTNQRVEMSQQPRKLYIAPPSRKLRPTIFGLGVGLPSSPACMKRRFATRPSRY